MLYGGQPATYARNLVRDFGAGIIEELERGRFEPVKLDVLWYEENIVHYTNLLAAIEQSRTYTV